MALIILVGPKHSGKTSTGTELAKILNIPFYDLDQLIEERTGQNVRALYNAGQALFRREEAAALDALFNLHKNTKKQHSGRNNRNCYAGVLAASGGIIDNYDAMILLQKEPRKHCTVYLELPAGTAWQRIACEGELPPFLKAETEEAAKEKHRILHEKRTGRYRQCTSIQIDAEGKSPAELAEKLYNLIP